MQLMRKSSTLARKAIRRSRHETRSRRWLYAARNRPQGRRHAGCLDRSHIRQRDSVPNCGVDSRSPPLNIFLGPAKQVGQIGQVPKLGQFGDGSCLFPVLPRASKLPNYLSRRNPRFAHKGDTRRRRIPVGGTSERIANAGDLRYSRGADCTRQSTSPGIVDGSVSR